MTQQPLTKKTNLGSCQAFIFPPLNFKKINRIFAQRSERGAEFWIEFSEKTAKQIR